MTLSRLPNNHTQPSGGATNYAELFRRCTGSSGFELFVVTLIVWAGFTTYYAVTAPDSDTTPPDNKTCLLDDDPNDPLKFTESALVDVCECVDARLKGSYINVSSVRLVPICRPSLT